MKIAVRHWDDCKEKSQSHEIHVACETDYDDMITIEFPDAYGSTKAEAFDEFRKQLLIAKKKVEEIFCALEKVTIDDVEER